MTDTPPADAPSSEAIPTDAPAADTPPDRLSTNPRSPHFDADLLMRGIGIVFNGQEKTNVDEYCVSEGWVKLAAGKSRDRHGNPMTVTLKGAVQPYFRDIAEQPEAGA